MPGVHRDFDDTYETTEAMTEAFRFVALSSAGKIKLPASAADAAAIVGILQETATASGKQVRVAKSGTSYLVADEAITVGLKIKAQSAGNKGRGLTLADPAKPANPGAGYVQAEAIAVNDFANNILTTMNTHVATALTAAAAQGDIIQVTLEGAPGLR